MLLLRSSASIIISKGSGSIHLLLLNEKTTKTNEYRVHALLGSR